jgi:hypothetical protein
MMRFALVLVLLIGGCRRVTRDDDGGMIADAAFDAGDAGATSTAMCERACASASDCATTSAAFDTDNYACTSSRCRYTGCVSDVECQSSFADARYVCRASFGGAPSCALGCNIATDCTSPSPAFDADNYRCEARTCVYAGCNDDSECTATFGAGYGCRVVPPPPAPIPVPYAARNCVRLCGTASDCATDGAAFSADNYACTGGACEWTGCRTDDECDASFAGDYVCR